MQGSVKAAHWTHIPEGGGSNPPSATFHHSGGVNGMVQ